MELRASPFTPSPAQSISRPPITDNRAALDGLFSQHRNRLYKTALRLMGNPEDAEDALQDGLLCAFSKLSGFRGRSRLSTWLTRIVINAALMRLRQRHPERMSVSIHHPVKLGQEPLANLIPDSRPDPEAEWARQERLQILEGELQGLPVEHHEAIRLYYLQGMSAIEVAETLRLPVATLKSRLHRARLRLARRPTCQALRRLRISQ